MFSPFSGYSLNLRHSNKSLARRECFPHFMDIALRCDIPGTGVYFPNFTDIALTCDTPKHERDLAGPGVYLPASEQIVVDISITGRQIDSWPCQVPFMFKLAII